MVWQKGRSGNPRGRPKLGLALSDQLRTLMAKKSEDDPSKTNAELVSAALLDAALAGNIPAIREIYERMDGKVPMPLTHSSPDGGPVRLDLSHLAEEIEQDIDSREAQGG